MTPINATARYLLVSATKETEAETVLAAIYPAQTSNVNPFTGRLELLVDSRTGRAPGSAKVYQPFPRSAAT